MICSCNNYTIKHSIKNLRLNLLVDKNLNKLGIKKTEKSKLHNAIIVKINIEIKLFKEY